MTFILRNIFLTIILTSSVLYVFPQTGGAEDFQYHDYAETDETFTSHILEFARKHKLIIGGVALGVGVLIGYLLYANYVSQTNLGSNNSSNNGSDNSAGRQNIEVDQGANRFIDPLLETRHYGPPISVFPLSVIDVDNLGDAPDNAANLVWARGCARRPEDIARCGELFIQLRNNMLASGNNQLPVRRLDNPPVIINLNEVHNVEEFRAATVAAIERVG